MRGLPEEPPDLRQAGNDVGLIAAVVDHPMASVRRLEVLAQFVEAHAHQLHRIERVAALPRR